MCLSVLRGFDMVIKSAFNSSHLLYLLLPDGSIEANLWFTTPTTSPTPIVTLLSRRAKKLKLNPQVPHLLFLLCDGLKSYAQDGTQLTVALTLGGLLKTKVLEREKRCNCFNM